MSKRINIRVAVRDARGAGLRDSGRAVLEDVVSLGGVSIGIAVEVGDDGELGGREVALLDQHLGAHADVDTRGGVVLEAGAVDVAGAEAERGQT